MKNIKNIFLAIAILVIVGFVFYAGYRVHPDPVTETTSQTIFKYDTIWRYIEVPYSVPPDTIIERDTVPAIIDTAAILKQHYSKFAYTRHFNDSLLEVNLLDTISENRFTGSKFSYRLLRPQTIINNSTTIKNYTNYLAAGISLYTTDAKLTAIEAIYITKDWYVGGGYMPWAKGINIKAGKTILKFK